MYPERSDRIDRVIDKTLETVFGGSAVALCTIGDAAIIGTLLREISGTSRSMLEVPGMWFGLGAIGVGAVCEHLHQVILGNETFRSSLGMFGDDLDSPVGTFTG